MISIGNDIVALAKINKQRTNDIRFQSKFITTAERGLYQQQSLTGLPFESYMWLLWSVKESVYKYQQRLDPEIIFAPVKIVIQNISPPLAVYDGCLEGEGLTDCFYQGRVKSNRQTLHFASLVSDDFVMSMVSHESSFHNVYWQIRHIAQTDNQSQSSSVRELLLNRLNHHLPKGNYTIQKADTGYPVLFNGGLDTHISVSITHHGHYIAYCFKLA